MKVALKNSLGLLFGVSGEFRQAHEHLDRAQVLFTSLKDVVALAQVDETRARVMLSERRLLEAEKTARAAVRALEKGDQRSLLAEALMTHGIALARLGHAQRAHATFQRATDVAAQAGDQENAGYAALAMIEELSACLSNDELRTAVDRLQSLIDNTQDISVLRRLARSICRGFLFLYEHPGFPPSFDWTNFCFKSAVLEYEAHVIKLALQEAHGRRKRAAELLGLNSRQGLTSLLKGRHKALADYPTPVPQRRRSIIRDGLGAPTRTDDE